MSKRKSGWLWGFVHKGRTLQRALRLTRKADQALAAKTYDVALPLYEESLKLSEDIEWWELVLGIRLCLGDIYYLTKNYRRAIEEYEASVRIATNLEFVAYLVRAMYRLARVNSHLGDYSGARRLCEKCLEVIPDRQRPGELSFIYSILGSSADSIGEAKSHYQQALELCRKTRDNQTIMAILCSLGHLTSPDQDNMYERACLEECLTLCRVSGNQQTLSYALNNLGNIERFAGNLDRAAELYRESLTMKQEAGDEWAIAYTLEGCAALAVARQQGDEAAKLFGAAAGIRKRLGTPLEPSKQPSYRANVEAARKLLTASTFESAWKEGEDLPLDQVIVEAISE